MPDRGRDGFKNVAFIPELLTFDPLQISRFRVKGSGFRV
jgi:hypothetical protein